MANRVYEDIDPEDDLDINETRAYLALRAIQVCNDVHDARFIANLALRETE